MDRAESGAGAIRRGAGGSGASDLLILPIDAHLPEAVERLAASGRLVLQAPPGTGKTTRLPPALVQALAVRAADRDVLVVEPRRIAARAAATRVAQERGCALGEEVGYRVRFESRVGTRTRLVYVTEGILLQRLDRDPELRGVGAVVFDEFHERRLDSDLALGLLREAREAFRPDLWLVVMSATLDPAPIARFLGEAPVLTAGGRAHPVEMRYAPRAESLPLEAAIASAIERLWREGRCDSILVFVPGAAEIRRTLGLLRTPAAAHGIDLLPLHGDLPLDAQERAIRGGSRPRIVLATNVAEASLTVEGVGAVIDSGLARVNRHDPARGVDSLRTERIARSSALQRAGRAGRTGPGVCIRLYSEAEFESLRTTEEPEVLRSDLTGAALFLLGWGVADPRSFAWPTPPAESALGAALHRLALLGAIDGGGPWRITEVGRAMRRWPVSPRTARFLVGAERLGVLSEAALVAAILEERDPRVGARPSFEGARASRSESASESDLLGLADELGRAATGCDPAFDARAVRSILRLSRQLGGRGGDGRSWAPAIIEALLRALLAAHPDRLVRRRAEGAPEGTMVAPRGATGALGARLDPESAVRRGAWYVAHDASLVRDERGRFVRVRRASRVEPDWVSEAFAPWLVRETVAEFDESSGRVTANRRVTFEGLVIEERALGAIDPEQASALLLEALERDPERAIEPGSEEAREVERFFARLSSVLVWRPDLAPDLTPDLFKGRPDISSLRRALLTDACRVLAPGRRSLREVWRAPLLETLRRVLPGPLLSSLERLAPDRIIVPSGRAIRLAYRPNEAPILAVRVQELFGLARTPRVNDGRTPVVLHLLAPSQRPVQVTSDLESFWRGVYPRLRNELRRRYPRHAWPEDPLRALPERGPMRRGPR